jgi:hypothetical protein
VFFGSPTLHSAGGIPGVRKALDIFRGESDLAMGQIGCPSLDQLGPALSGTRIGHRTADAVCAPQLPADCATGLVVAGRSSALSISSKVRPLVSGPNAQKPMTPRMYQDAK